MKQTMIAKSSMLMMSLFVLFCSAFAQTKTISGKVTDASGNPVANASVVPKGSSRGGTSTGADGSFSISVSDATRALVISALSYETKEVSIAGLSSVTVSLVSTASVQQEVVVVGYGTARKKDLTGSVASVKAKDFNKGVVTSPDQLIQGKVTGLQIVNNSGQPGGGTTIRIRGTSSVRSGNNPLIVVDGIPLSGGTGRPGLGLAAFGSSPASNPLNFINPNDIESIDVLKDASASAIYGSRGANGVILITTKKGQVGAPTLDVNISVGTGKIMKQLEVLDGNEYRAALTKYGLSTGNYGGNENAVDAILRNSSLQNVSVAAGGGSETAKFRFTGSALQDNGIIKESDLKKFTVNLVSNFKLLNNRRLGLDINMGYSSTKEGVVPITNDAGFEGNLLGQALQWNPTHPLKKADGTYWIEPQFGNTSINPAWFLQMYDDNATVNTVIASISPSYKFNNDLEYRFLYSINQSNGYRTAMIGRQLTNIPRYKDRGEAFVASGLDKVQQFAHTLNYNKSLNSKIDLNALLGYEYTKFNAGQVAESAQDFADIGIPYYNMMGYASQSSRQVVNYESPSNELQSYFARAKFGYDDKYLLTATVRADGSTKFGENNKYGVFPAFAAAWNISNENFMKNISSDKVANVKLRLGWGQTGNQEFPSGAAVNRYGVSGIASISQLNVANPDLKWETSSTTNIGLDFSVLKRRITVTADYFNKLTKDVLFELTFPQPGASSARIWKNLPATITNSGFELGINSKIIDKADFTWNLNLFATFLKNQLDDLSGTYNTGALHGQGSTGAFVQKLASGYPLNVYYLRAYQGIDPTTGQSIYKENGDVSYFGKSPNPDKLLGITTDVSYKNWTLTANLNGAMGHYLYNNTATSVVPITNLGTRNVAKTLVNQPIKEDLSNPITSSDRYLEKGDYLKFSNLTVSYNLGSMLKFAKSARVSVTGQNLAVFTKFTGFDPEVNVDKNIGGVPSNGIEYIPYPTARRYQLSLNFSF